MAIKKDGVGNDRLTFRAQAFQPGGCDCDTPGYEDEVGNDNVVDLSCSDSVKVLRTLPMELTDEERNIVREYLKISDITRAYIAANGHLFLVMNDGTERDVGDARGIPGDTPEFGDNGNWFIGGKDTGKPSRGPQGDTPYVGENGNWWVSGVDLGTPATPHSVGDIVETVRTDLGENWVLCNGDAVHEDAYPELYGVRSYNTEWKRLYEGYGFFRPMSETGFWYINLNFNDSQANNYRSAMVYDSNTGSALKITCPTIADSTNYGMFGMTHDGKQFILGVYDRTKAKIRLFTSTDLESWVECLQAACESNTTPYDITFDGTYILVLAAYNNSNITYKTYVYSITPDTWTKKTLWDFTTSDSNKRYFRLCPYGLWSLTYDGETTAFIYNSGTTTQAFYYTASSCGGKFVFFNDRYVFTAEDNDDGAIHDTMVYDIVDKTSTTFYWRKAVGDSSGYYYLRGLKYNKNTNEWELNIDGGSGTYISYISADANPSDNTQYRFEKVVAHPKGLSMKNERMGLDRSQLRFVSGTEMYANNPNVKYLPTHDGETYKYIYAGGANE